MEEWLNHVKADGCIPWQFIKGPPSSQVAKDAQHKKG